VNSIKNERGSVIVFITLMIVLLLVMVGMGLDTGHLAFVRAGGQPAVDAAALAAASAVPTGSLTNVESRAAAFNSQNTFQGSGNSTFQIAPTNVTLVSYDESTRVVTRVTNIADANGARVALEDSNPHGGTANKAMKSPLFLTPLFNLMGTKTSGTQSVSVSAVAVVKAQPDLPIAAQQGMCGTKVNGSYVEQQKVKLLQSNNNNDTSGYTTFYIQNASKTQIDNLLQGALNCTGAPSVDVGFCTELNNGQVASLYPEFEKVFLADKSTSRCYFIPIVKDGVTFNQCSKILDFARFCPLECVECGFGGKTTFGIDKVSGGGSDRWVYGKMTCGQSPTRSLFARCQVPFLVRDAKSGM
jgi:Flp pilus assembly protein TadG